jgi:hypothetical protein
MLHGEIMAVQPLPARPPLLRRRPSLMLILFLVLFVLPVLARAALYAFYGGPLSWRDADWSSIGSLPSAAQHPEARFIVYSGRTGGWKGVVSVHSWIVLKRPGDKGWTRYDVVGWGTPLRTNGWAPDGRWFGNRPTVVVDLKGKNAEAVLPRVEQAVKSYRFRHAGGYRMWPGPNSNSFVAAVLRAVPEVGAVLPANAIGRDFRPRPYLGRTDTGSGIEANLWGVVGVKVGRAEGFEVNMFGLVVGLDLRHPGIKLPGFGRIGLGPSNADTQTEARARV